MCLSTWYQNPYHNRRGEIPLSAKQIMVDQQEIFGGHVRLAGGFWLGYGRGFKPRNR